MKFFSKTFQDYSEQNTWHLNCFRVVFCLFLIIPVLRLQIPIGIYRPIPTLEWTHVFIRTTEAFFLLKVTTAFLLLLAGLGIWTRFCLWVSTAFLFFLVSNAYSFLYDPVTGYMPNEFNLPWIVLLILALAPGVSHLKLRSISKLSIGVLDSAPRWPITLIVWTLGTTYLAAFFSKVRWGGWSFGDGEILQGYLLEFGLFRGNELALWLSSQASLVAFLASMTLFFELTAIVGFSLARLRLFYILMGLVFHGFIFLLFGIDFFTKYLPVYFICVNWSWLRSYITKTHAPERNI